MLIYLLKSLYLTFFAEFRVPETGIFARVVKNRMSDSAALSDNDKNTEILNSASRPQPSFSLKASMLRPSAFGSSTQSSSAKSILRPASFQLGGGAPQAKDKDADGAENEASPIPTPNSTSPSDEKTNDVNSTEINQNESADSTTSTSINPFVAQTTTGKVENGGSEAAADSKPEASVTSPATPSSILGKNIFVPKAANLFAAATKPNTIPNNNDSNIGFVFGQNIHERTAGAPEQSSSNNGDTKGDSTSSNELFAAAANHVSSSSLATSSDKSDSQASGSASQSDTKESSTVEDLTKVAQAYEESRDQNKRKYDEVKTFTGEEDEICHLDVNCKLYAFVASNWEERGPGSLRLNDPRTPTVTANSTTSPKSKCSRVVFRTSGNLRVLMNTKVWPGMVVEKSSQKSLRLTAIDSSDGQIKIFLAMARPDDISSLHSALKKRIAQEKERAQSQAEDGDDEEPIAKKEKKED